MNTRDFSNDPARLQAVWASIGIPPRLNGASLENYLANCPEKQQALDKCRGFAESGMEKITQGKGLFLQGLVGTGKSHLVVAVLREIIEMNLEHFGMPAADIRLVGEPVYEGLCCSMISVVDLLGSLRESFGAEQLKAPAQRLLRRARGDAVLVLDDIGAEKPSDWVEEQLYALIDLRYRMQRSTFFTTNCTLKQLEKQIGSRSVSRIIEMCEGVKVGGEDWRKRGIG